MELIDLLNEGSWDRSRLDYSREQLEREMRPQVLSNVRTLFRHYYSSLMLNGAFLAITIGCYFLRPVVDMLLPIAIIGAVFVFLIVNIASQLLSTDRVDTSQNVKQVIEESLTYNHRINRRVWAYQSAIFTASGVGGFLLVLMIQGWSVQKIVDKPMVLVVLAVVAVGLYFSTKSNAFKQLNRSLNRHYLHTKKYLEEQLAVLEA